MARRQGAGRQRQLGHGGNGPVLWPGPGAAGQSRRPAQWPQRPGENASIAGNGHQGTKNQQDRCSGVCGGPSPQDSGTGAVAKNCDAGLGAVPHVLDLGRRQVTG